MSVLKGNYDLKIKDKSAKTENTKNKISDDFEKYAGKHLGGSIAFVMKNGTFLLDDECNTEKEKKVNKKK
tara:strand:+ start:65 stop:274 length:210 start_codon:yes stop_codon:yes gene_type:complete